MHYHSDSNTNGSKKLPNKILNGLRVFKGSPAKDVDVPWQAALKDSESGTVFCGGTLIGERYVLTAPHCFEGTEGWGYDFVVGMVLHKISAIKMLVTSIMSTNFTKKSTALHPT